MSDETRHGAGTGGEGPDAGGPGDGGAGEPGGRATGGPGPEASETGPGEAGDEARGSERGERGRSWSGSFSEIGEAVNDLVDGVFRGFSPLSGSRFPRYDLVRVPGEGYRLLLDLPGVDREDVDVSMVGDELVVSGERRRPEVPAAAEVHRSERGYGRFRRAVRLPSDVDPAGISAKLEDGVLRLTLPVREESERQRVEIQ